MSPSSERDRETNVRCFLVKALHPRSAREAADGREVSPPQPRRCSIVDVRLRRRLYATFSMRGDQGMSTVASVRGCRDALVILSDRPAGIQKVPLYEKT